MENLTFDQLPNAVTNLTKEIGEIKRLIIEHQSQVSEQPSEQLLTVPQVAKFLNLTVPTIYSKVSKGQLPVMKQGKRLYFSNHELMNYLKEGRIKTQSELDDEANNYLQKSKR